MTPTRPRRTITMLVIAGIVLILAYLVWGTTTLVQAECSLCVEFRGATQCRTGSGTTDEEAQRAAQRAACAVMASGMDESIACQNRPVTQVRCTGG